MKIAFSITIDNIHVYDEMTAKEVIATYLQSGLNVKVDDITILAMEPEDYEEEEKIECRKISASAHFHEIDHDEFHFFPEEQIKHMED